MTDTLENELPGGAVPVGRDSFLEILGTAALIQKVPVIQSLMDAIPHVVMVINSQCQIVAANAALFSMLCTDAPGLVGKRPGEAMNCVHSTEGPGGCGTSTHCLACQAVRAVLKSQQSGTPVRTEARLTINKPSGTGAMELLLTATPIVIEDQPLIFCVLEDISDRIRLNVLMQIFFHDVMNTAGCIYSLADYLHRTPAAALEDEGFLAQLARMTGQLLDEIRSQRDLSEAESGELEVAAVPVGTREVLEDLQAAYAGHSVATERQIEFSELWDGQIVTDCRLLLRVLGNMLKNALEATPPGGTVTLGCAEVGPRVMFSVHNATVIPPEVQLQIFQRSFSTKVEAGHGLGTHSIKLIGERYLRGKVAFSSNSADGTTFTITLPKSIGS